MTIELHIHVHIHICKHPLKKNIAMKIKWVNFTISPSIFQGKMKKYSLVYVIFEASYSSLRLKKKG